MKRIRLFFKSNDWFPWLYEIIFPSFSPFPSLLKLLNIKYHLIDGGFIIKGFGQVDNRGTIHCFSLYHVLILEPCNWVLQWFNCYTFFYWFQSRSGWGRREKEEKKRKKGKLLSKFFQPERIKSTRSPLQNFFRTFSESFQKIPTYGELRLPSLSNPSPNQGCDSWSFHNPSFGELMRSSLTPWSNRIQWRERWWIDKSEVVP